MSATYCDCAIGWLELAESAVERARECMRVGAEQSARSLAETRAAYEADRALRAILWDIVDEMTAVRFAKIVRDRIAESLRADGEAA